MAIPDLIAIGEVTRTHGLTGELRVALLTDRPERFKALAECVVWDMPRDRRETRRIRATRLHGGDVLVQLEGCDSIDDAKTLVGRLLAVPESEVLALPEGQFYPWQLEGARVLTTGGAEVGTVTGIEPSPAHDLWVISGPDGREHLIPAVPEIVTEVDVAAGRVVIDPPDGLLEL